ncbi:MAG TPA: hypothetical protein VFG87_05860 [Amycolatopsis sp.]|nr:hypothetical protein [Amycolatopsis sp.]
MRKRLVTRVLTAAALATIFTGGLFTGTASASTVLAQGCTGSVVGNMGDQVAVQGKDLADLVRAGAQQQEVFLHLNGVDPDKLAQEISGQGALTVGQVPNAANAPLTGKTIAGAVHQALQNADGLGANPDTKQNTLDAIGKSVAGNCGLTLYAANYSAMATTSLTPGTTAPATTGMAVPGVPVGTGSATAPPRDYGNVPAVEPGIPDISPAPGARYPATTSVPDVLPPEVGVAAGDTPGQADVRNAGNASALSGGDPAETTVQLPMLLAVVAIAGVSAALVRTWVLRKVS